MCDSVSLIANTRAARVRRACEEVLALLRSGAFTPVPTEVVPAAELMPVALAMARKIAAKAPLAVAYAKRSANMVDVMPQRDAYRFEQEFTMALSRTEDAREARQAFLEKRPPQFQGR